MAAALVSWYACCLLTASGQPFHPEGMTAASPYRADMGRVVYMVTDTGEATVRINDVCGGCSRVGRRWDVSRGAFRRLAPLSRGVTRVHWKYVN
jgi:rare lipoprotein A (peptidoglycan hydrolase)